MIYSWIFLDQACCVLGSHSTNISEHSMFYPDTDHPENDHSSLALPHASKSETAGHGIRFSTDIDSLPSSPREKVEGLSYKLIDMESDHTLTSEKRTSSEGSESIGNLITNNPSCSILIVYCSISSHHPSFFLLVFLYSVSYSPLPSPTPHTNLFSFSLTYIYIILF